MLDKTVVLVFCGDQDYFDVIDTPMDFGTIRTNLESGGKYLNSEDVYKDVQYIWDNCYKYNNKGDLVLDLMKRVKKNFSKYWSAAGLYSDYTQGNYGKIYCLGFFCLYSFSFYFLIHNYIWVLPLLILLILCYAILISLILFIKLLHICLPVYSCLKCWN